MHYSVTVGISTIVIPHFLSPGSNLELQCICLADVVTAPQARLGTSTAHHEAISVEHPFLTPSRKSEYLKRRPGRPSQSRRS